MTRAQWEELMHFMRAIEALERGLDNSPYFDDEIRASLLETIEACRKQLNSAPVS